MTAFDIRTAFLILGLRYLLLPTITWVVLAGQRLPQVTLWCSAGLLAGGSFILTGLLDLGVPWHVPGMGGAFVELHLPNLAHT